ncbi:MAG: DUF4919 domain-containing protein [Acidobacteriota bacterium]
MKRSVSLLAVLIFLVIAATAQPAAQAPDYESLLTKAKRGEKGLDYAALRIAYAATSDFNPVVDAKVRVEMYKLIKEKKFKEAIKLAEAVHKTNFVDISSHMVLALAYAELKDQPKADFHKNTYLGLVNSIINSGDGETAKTAYIVISVPEEYAILDAFEYKRGTQEVVTENGHKYDVLTVTDTKTNSPVKMYFNIDIVWKGYDKVFPKTN